MWQGPGCTVAGSVPVFTYAPLTPVARRHVGVLAEIGYMRHLALMPSPIALTPIGLCFAHPIRFAVVSTQLRGFYTAIRVAGVFPVTHTGASYSRCFRKPGERWTGVRRHTLFGSNVPA